MQPADAVRLQGTTSAAAWELRLSWGGRRAGA